MKTEEAISSFIDSAAAQGMATEEGDYKKGNRHYKAIVKAVDWLRKNGQTGALEALLEHPNAGVSIWAATYLLETQEDKARAVLAEIMNQGIRHHSFTAQKVLEEWNRRVKS